MNGGSLEVTTEAQRERLHRARSQGGLCAACGRVLAAEETVYVERFLIEAPRPSYAEAPVGVECASPELLRQAAEQDPEQCAGCGRPVYYRVPRRTRRRALCARPCANRVVARRAAKTEEVG